MEYEVAMIDCFESVICEVCFDERERERAVYIYRARICSERVSTVCEILWRVPEKKILGNS